MSTGTLQPPDTAPPAGTPPGAITVCARGWRAAWTSQQAGLARFNCADSLDRTNAASYFAGVQALAEAVGRLGLDAGPRGAGGGGRGQGAGGSGSPWHTVCQTVPCRIAVWGANMHHGMCSVGLMRQPTWSSSTGTPSHRDSSAALSPSLTPPPLVRNATGTRHRPPRCSCRSSMRGATGVWVAALCGAALGRLLRVSPQARVPDGLTSASASLASGSTWLPRIRTPSMSNTKASGPAGLPAALGACGDGDAVLSGLACAQA